MANEEEAGQTGSGTASDRPLLAIRNVCAAYGPIVAIQDVSLHVNAGEIVTLIGANGAGKSTLLMTIFSNPQAKSGHVFFDGQPITHMPTHHIAQMGISLVPEGRRIFPAMTVEENLALGLVAAGGKNATAELAHNFQLFPILQERRLQRAGTLSGGEQQMLAIGRALMSRPKLLLLDEPSLGLAPMMIKRIFAQLKEIALGGTTIFLVEQNANQALRLADRGYVLVNGSVRMEGTGMELLNNPQVRRAYLGGD